MTLNALYVLKLDKLLFKFYLTTYRYTVFPLEI